MNDGPKEGRVRLSLEALNTLQVWLDKHAANPYPTQEEKQTLANRTKLSMKQVSNWFVNARRRQPSPLEVWISSSSEDEAASPSDVFRAVQSGDLPTFNSSRRNSLSHSQASSISSARSAFSQCNEAVIAGPKRKGRKRHRFRPFSGDKKPENDYHGSNNSSSFVSMESDNPFYPFSFSSPHSQQDLKSKNMLSPSPNKSSGAVYPCTFCHKELTAKTWKRHEEKVHLPRSQWICMPKGFLSALDPAREDIVCSFCGELDATEGHFMAHHRAAECYGKPELERTFNRKDHLKQHLNRFHGVHISNDDVIKDWERKMDHSHHVWHCGFCGVKLRDWDHRAMHIGGHFREGMSMASWDSKLFARNQDSTLVPSLRISSIPAGSSVKETLRHLKQERPFNEGKLHQDRGRSRLRDLFGLPSTSSQQQSRVGNECSTAQYNANAINIDWDKRVHELRTLNKVENEPRLERDQVAQNVLHHTFGTPERSDPWMSSAFDMRNALELDTDSPMFGLDTFQNDSVEWPSDLSIPNFDSLHQEFVQPQWLLKTAGDPLLYETGFVG
jgi:hypothetical protein